ncbi:peptidase E [Winogradskyella maritima]|uniref:DUF6702 family protein n=1 Tax=Winogradskyella maritima TaxID=1517766 RepID=A0ABV8AK34_9FLAO|nr:peptidase E [Winogradskyella maritima]
MKSRIVILTLIALPLFMAMSVAHKYYVSVTKIVYAKEEKAVQITSQIFIDDFENLLRERYDETITLAGKDESKNVDMYMQRYLTDKLKLVINGKEADINYLGHEYKEDITYCYLEVLKVEGISSMKITNEVLFDMFDEQQNIVRTEINSKKKSFLMIPEKNQGVLNFD